MDIGFYIGSMSKFQKITKQNQNSRALIKGCPQKGPLVYRNSNVLMMP